MPDDNLWDETRWYGRWTSEVLRGEWSGADLESYSPFLTTPVPRQPIWLRDRLGPLILAAMARLPGSDVRSAFLAADLVFPCGAAFALMLLGWEMQPSSSFAVAATSLIMFFNWQDARNLIAFLRGSPQNSAMFLRTPYPQLSMILFATFLLFLIRLVRKVGPESLVWLAVLLTLNFFAYIYSWTYALAFLVATGLVLLASALIPGLDLMPQAKKRIRRTICGSGSHHCNMLRVGFSCLAPNDRRRPGYPGDVYPGWRSLWPSSRTEVFVVLAGNARRASALEAFSVAESLAASCIPHCLVIGNEHPGDYRKDHPAGTLGNLLPSTALSAVCAGSALGPHPR